jgi:valyl-tRNA synthetase
MIPKAYEPGAVEEKWYEYWLKENCFVADAHSSKPAYSIVIPPPNVTGMLHLGHVLNNTIQDILSRKARMEGKEVLWLPGTDHAGIGTQAVVERDLRKQGLMKHRDDLGREKFLEHAWTWKEKHGGIIIEQLRKLGCSCDWTRERFTMDPAYSRCVQRVFAYLYKKGLIYRGRRMVNWDPAARTALSDEEVEMIEEKGQLWHVKYPLLDSLGQQEAGQFIIVATTRPETMLGDEAVAVNPQDPRYSDLVGRRCLLPLKDKAIPIITDDFVDPKFGTGCVKVTPAHDPNDYEMGLRHHLPVTVVMGTDGAMTAEAGDDFIGLDRLEARQAVIERLSVQGLLLKTEEYVHNVGYSQRSHVPIEPYLSEQWFLKYPSVDASTRAVEENRIHFHPERWSKTYSHWMHNIRDWCISRQLWWGHQVPVWEATLTADGGATVTDPSAAYESLNGVRKTLSSRSDVSCRLTLVNGNTVELSETTPLPSQQEIARVEVCLGPDSADMAKELERFGLVQSPDVLDTWFSSWLWPFATMGWPEKTETLKKFYPTSDLVTGPDIIFFWVARMIMAGYEFMGDLPFRNVYFTGIIRDKLGRKMSKSLGNSPDPLELIAKYGADALRFGTMRSAPLGQDVLFDEKDVELGRNFCNKLWNACRFRQLQQGEVQAEILPELLTSYDKWIVLKLDQAIGEITNAFAEYRFNEVTQTLYRFFWNEYCDWYVEASKAVLARPSDNTPANPTSSPEAQRANALAVIDFVLSHTLRLFHPFLPFIAEELWHGMGYHQEMPANQGGNTIMFAPWPRPFDEDFRAHYGLDGCYLEIVESKFFLVTQGRNLRREANVPAGKKAKFVLKPSGVVPPLDVEVFKLLLNAESVQLDLAFQAEQGTPVVHSEMGDLFLLLEGVQDVAAETTRLGKELEKIESEITKAEQKLNNPNFTTKAPAHVLSEHQQRLAEWKTKRDRVKTTLDRLKGSGE